MNTQLNIKSTLSLVFLVLLTNSAQSFAVEFSSDPHTTTCKSPYLNGEKYRGEVQYIQYSVEGINAYDSDKNFVGEYFKKSTRLNPGYTFFDPSTNESKVVLAESTKDVSDSGLYFNYNFVALSYPLTESLPAVTLDMDLLARDDYSSAEQISSQLKDSALIFKKCIKPIAVRGTLDLIGSALADFLDRNF